MTAVQSPAILRRPGAGTLFFAGVVGAAAMLVVAVALRAVTGIVSLPEIVADGFLLLLPGAAFSATLDALGRAAKPLLYAGIVVGALVTGGLLARWQGAPKDFQAGAMRAAWIWAALGLVFYPLLGAGMFGAALDAGAIWHALSLLVLVAVYVGVTAQAATFPVLGRQPADARIDQADRRRILQGAVLLGVVVVGGAGLARVLRSLGASAGAGPAGDRPIANAAPFDVPGLSPEVTPNDVFYTVSKNFTDPTVQADNWHLRIDGMVAKPMDLDYAALRNLPASDGFYTLMCISNEVGGDLMGNARWRGVKLAWLLDQAGVDRSARKVVFSAADDYQDSVPLDRALHPDALLAWEMNGETLPHEHGYPARLLIPGIYGMKNVKWVTGITVVPDDFQGYWQKRGWDDAAPYHTASRIDVPHAREEVARGTAVLAGVAFAGDRGISRVEVSGDGGQTWSPATLSPALSAFSWRLWRADLTVGPDTRDVRVRAVDGQGKVQEEAEMAPFPSGSSGYHIVPIRSA